MIVGGQTEARAQLSSTIMSRLTRALRFVRARAHVRALMTQKSCAVGMLPRVFTKALAIERELEKETELIYLNLSL